MHAALQQLCQYHHPHLQAYLLQAEENLAFVQHPAKVGELFGLGTRGTCLGEEVLLDGIDVGATSVMFHVHLPMSAHKGRRPFLACDDGTLSAI
jgi:hypothetical protein